MANQLITDTAQTTGKVFDSGFEYPIEREILLADYDEPVFKIVKTCVEHTITQKYINGSKLILEGFFKISIYYQPPAGANLTVVSKKLPFQKQFDLSSSVQPPYFINIDGEIQYVNTRAVNSTRIDVRGAYQFLIKAYGLFQTQIVTAINSKTVCCDNEQLSHFCLCGQGSRQFSVEDEITYNNNFDKILNITAKNNNMSVNVYDNKVNVKGDISAEIAYTVKDLPDIQKQIKTFAYNQIIDIDDISPNNSAYAEFSIISFTVTQNPDTKQVNCVVSANIDVKVFKKQEIISVLDAFSKEYEYSKNRQKAVIDENIETICKNININLEENIGNNCSMFYHFVSASTPTFFIGDEKNVLRTRISVNAIVKNARNEFECFTKNQDVNIDIGDKISADDEYILSCKVTDSRAIISGDVMKIKLVLNTDGFAIKRRTEEVIREFEEQLDRPILSPANALVVYYGQKGEKIFDIALRYKTDADKIAQENLLDGKILTEDKMLFIPAFGL